MTWGLWHTALRIHELLGQEGTCKTLQMLYTNLQSTQNDLAEMKNIFIALLCSGVINNALFLAPMYTVVNIT